MEYLLFLLSSLLSIYFNKLKNINKLQIKNILVVRLDHLGDMVCSINSLQMLRQKFPDANIILLTGKWNVDLIANNPIIDNLFIYNSKRFSRNINQVSTKTEKKQIRNSLYNLKPDLIVGLRDDFFTLKLTWNLHPKFRLDRGTTRIKIKMYSILNILRLSSKELDNHEISTNEMTLKSLNLSNYIIVPAFYLSEDENFWFNNFLKEKGLEKNNYAVIHPGASWSFKRWHPSNFYLIGEYLRISYNLKMIIIGSADETNIGAEIEENGKDHFINLVGQTTLRQSIIIICNAKIAICNDSSPMHIAAVSGIPTIGLMGPADPSKFSPRGAKAIYHHIKVDCHPCDQKECIRPEMPCIELISPKMVMASIRELLLQNQSYKLN